MIYILNRHGIPLMPTNRQSHIRKLIKQGLAVVISGTPFVVRLKYDTDEITQPLTLGVDSGRENIGLGVTKENGAPVYKAEVETHNKSIKKQMDERRQHRFERRHNARAKRQRRAFRDGNVISGDNSLIWKNRKPCSGVVISYSGIGATVTHKVIRGREAKFNNRKSSDISPSARQLVQMHELSIRLVLKILPITKIVVEGVSFDFQKLQDANISDWQHGPLYGYKSYKDYVSERQNGVCALCGINKIDEFHHIVPRNAGGSDTVRNIIGICHGCHHGLDGVHKKPDAALELMKKSSGERSKYKVSLLNSTMPLIIDAVNSICAARSIEMLITDGYHTKQTRELFGLMKTHSDDAIAISLYKNDSASDLYIGKQIETFKIRRFKKKSGNNIAKLGRREYYLNGELVAINRNKAECQMEDSLCEYKAKLLETMSTNDVMIVVSKLSATPAKRVYSTKHDDSLVRLHPGDTVRYEKHNKINGKTKLATFIAESVEESTGRVIHHKTKNKKIKYCRSIETGCLKYIN